jgi:hypothetical protein
MSKKGHHVVRVITVSSVVSKVTVKIASIRKVKVKRGMSREKTRKGFLLMRRGCLNPETSQRMKVRRNRTPEMNFGAGRFAFSRPAL